MALSRQVANNPDVRLLTVMKYEPDEERVIRTRLRLSGLLAPTRRGNSTTRHLSNGPNANDAAQKKLSALTTHSCVFSAVLISAMIRAMFASGPCKFGFFKGLNHAN